MIKNYKIFKESLLNYLGGPSFDEVINNISAFRFKINSKEEFYEYLEYFMNKKILGDNITIGTYMDDYIHYEYDKTYYKKYFLELCVGTEPIEFAQKYKESFGKYNILVSIITESEINSGDVCKFILDDTSRIDDIINILIKKSERIVDWSRDEEFGYENDDDEITESLLNKLEGPNEEEVLDSLKDNPDKLLKVSLDLNFIKGINFALENGAKIKNLRNNNLYDKIFKYLNYNEEQIINTLEVPNHILEYAYSINDKNLMKYALENGAKFNNEQLNHLLYESFESFEYLCKNVKDFKINDAFIKRLFFEKKSLDIKKLIDLGCIDIMKDGLDYLKCAAFIGNIGVVKLLLDAGVKIPKDFNFDDIMYDDIIEILKKII